MMRTLLISNDDIQMNQEMSGLWLHQQYDKHVKSAIHHNESMHSYRQLDRRSL